MPELTYLNKLKDLIYLKSQVPPGPFSTGGT